MKFRNEEEEDQLQSVFSLEPSKCLTHKIELR